MGIACFLVNLVKTHVEGEPWGNDKVVPVLLEGHGFQVVETTSLLAGVKMRTFDPL